MAYDTMPRPVVDYAPCRYGQSKLQFRGPQQRLAGRFTAVLGGSETYGRYVEQPYPSLLEQATGIRTVNFGCMNAGPDAFLNDDTVIMACQRASHVVIQIGGAQNLSNRFYSVHPRRNDRFVKASTMMRAVFPEVDFTEFHFTGHMLGTLEETSSARFALIRDELRRVWVARMNLLTSRIGKPVHLLWMAERGPDTPGDSIADGGPLFITRVALQRLRGRIAGTVIHVYGAQSGFGTLDGKFFEPEHVAAALALPGPGAHASVARQLTRGLLACVK